MDKESKVEEIHEPMMSKDKKDEFQGIALD